MSNREKIVKGLECCIESEDEGCPMECPFYKECLTDDRPFYPVISAALKLLKEQGVREFTIDEWKEWKANPKRDPICMLWENDTSPIWVHNPNVVHEPALLMGKLKLFTGKPTFEQCKAVKWDA